MPYVHIYAKQYITMQIYLYFLPQPITSPCKGFLPIFDIKWSPCPYNSTTLIHHVSSIIINKSSLHPRSCTSCVDGKNNKIEYYDNT